MPKVLTPAKRQKIALLAAIERGKLATGLPYDKDVAAKIGLHQSRYSALKKNGFNSMYFADFRNMAQVLQLTPREVCEALGVPYRGKEEGNG